MDSSIIKNYIINYAKSVLSEMTDNNKLFILTTARSVTTSLDKNCMPTILVFDNIRMVCMKNDYILIDMLDHAEDEEDLFISFINDCVKDLELIFVRSSFKYKGEVETCYKIIKVNPEYNCKPLSDSLINTFTESYIQEYITKVHYALKYIHEEERSPNAIALKRSVSYPSLIKSNKDNTSQDINNSIISKDNCKIVLTMIDKDYDDSHNSIWSEITVNGNIGLHVSSNYISKNRDNGDVLAELRQKCLQDNIEMEIIIEDNIRYLKFSKEFDI